jgi:hypothetical protein
MGALEFAGATIVTSCTKNKMAEIVFERTEKKKHRRGERPPATQAQASAGG